MIVFTLTMHRVGTWNGKWTGRGSLYCRCKDERKVSKECWNGDFRYNFRDGWTACVTTQRMSASEARKLERKSRGFCGYDWMIDSIIECNEIITPEERQNRLHCAEVSD